MVCKQKNLAWSFSEDQKGKVDKSNEKCELGGGETQRDDFTRYKACSRWDVSCLHFLEAASITVSSLVYEGGNTVRGRGDGMEGRNLSLRT